MIRKGDSVMNHGLFESLLTITDHGMTPTEASLITEVVIQGLINAST